MIQNRISKFFSKKLSTSDQPTDPRPKFHIPIPYFGSQSDKLTKELSNLLSTFTSSYKLVIVQRNDFRIGKFFNYKDKLLSERESLLFISFVVRNTYASTWVAPRISFTTVRQHEGRSFRTGAPLSQPAHSKIRDPCALCIVSFVICDFRILSCASSEFEL